MEYINYETYLKDQLSKEDWKILQRMHLNLDPKAWTELAIDFVNFDKRRQKEVPFLLQQIGEYQYLRVFDACLGTGATSIGIKLADRRIEVFGNEIDINLEKIAREEMRKRGIDVDFPIEVYNFD